MPHAIIYTSNEREVNTMNNYKMSENEKVMATALVEDMVAHGYHLMQYKTARAMVDHYDCFTLEWWQKTHDRFVGA